MPDNRQLSPIEEVRHSMSSPAMRGEIAKALPPHIPVDRFIRVAMTAIQREPKLLDANRQSLYGACMLAAQDGLVPDGRDAALTIFGNTVQYMPMIGGILKKIRQSGELVSISAHVVREGDEFDYWIDEKGTHFKHRPNMEKGDAAVTMVYAVATTIEGGVYFEPLTKADVEKIRNVSRAKNGGPWKDWWEEMAKKSAIRRLAKRLPMATDVEDVIKRDDSMVDLDGGDHVDTGTGEVTRQGGRPSRLQVVADQAPAAATAEAREPAEARPGDGLPADKPATSSEVI